ncbi:MAG: HypC/HybG/HupF family hydrogenase formation chaperone [Meiothermus sp.]|nr:HypC/HybG/HupF family hydrogenase formation chaperone [Meiothermus sp.]
MPKVDLEFYGSCTLDQDGCSTCGDVAVPVEVLEILGGDAVVEDRLGRQATVAIDFFPEARVGDALLVHMGVAISRLEEPA